MDKVKGMVKPFTEEKRRQIAEPARWAVIILFIFLLLLWFSGYFGF